jgi:ubiquinone/menaquinone biosynthesis C-methylase UbiE
MKRIRQCKKIAAAVLLRLLRMGRKDKVLDLGCRIGHISITIRELSNGQVVGVDPSPGIIAKAR